MDSTESTNKLLFSHQRERFLSEHSTSQTTSQKLSKPALCRQRHCSLRGQDLALYLMLCSHLKCPHSCCTSTLSNGLRQGCSNTESHRHWKGRMVWEVFSWWISSNIPPLANNPMGCLMALVLCLLPAMGSEATCHPCQNS